MPQLIGALILSIIGVGSTAGFTIAGVTITYAALVGTAVLVAASIALQLLLQPSTKSTDGQLTLQQPIPFRRRVYGRAKVGGYIIFQGSQNGVLHRLIALAAHEIDAFEAHWLDDRQVTVDGSGDVTGISYPPGAVSSNEYGNGSSGWIVQLFYSRGDSGKTADANLIAAFPGAWTTDHIGYGIADVHVRERGVKQQDYARHYPGGPHAYRGLIRGARVIDPRVLTSPTPVAWSDNAVVVIRDYLTHQDGWRIASQYFDSGLGAPITADAMATCDELVALKSGGNEARYRIWGFYEFGTEPRQVLATMLAACAGWLRPMPDGSIAIYAGKWIAPTVTISDDHILGFEIQHFVGEFNAVNEVRATFTDPTNDYQDTESSPWQDAADISRRGYIKSINIDARYCPSYTQTRRIQKIGYKESSPEYSVTLTTDAYGLAARGQRFVNVVIDKLGLSLTCRMTSFVANIQTGVCTIGLATFGPDAYDWDPAAEEGPPPPIPTDTSNVNDVETPTGLTVTVETQSVSSSSLGVFIVVSCDAPTDRNDLTAKFEYQTAGSSAWTVLSTNDTDYQAQSGILAEGRYNVRVSFLAANNAQSTFDEVDNVLVSVANAAPDSPTSLTATTLSPALGVLLTAVAPNSSNFVALEFWRGSTNVFSAATEISGPIYGSPNQTLTYSDAPGHGTWYYWATAESGVSPPTRSTPVGPQSITI